MKFIQTEIEGCYIIEYNTFEDDRGYFGVTFNEDEFNQNVGYDVKFIQDNMSYSHYGVVRGLHFQRGEYAQSKLVTCTQGVVLDVAVDIRENSPTYKNVVKVELGWDKKRLLFVPRGCAHGFSVISPMATFQYKVDNYYNKQSEGGIIYNDPTFNIDWRVNQPIVSEKDLELPTFLSL